MDPQRVPPHCVGITPFLIKKMSKTVPFLKKTEIFSCRGKGKKIRAKRDFAITKGFTNKMHYDLRAREETCFDHFLTKIDGFGPPFLPKIIANVVVSVPEPDPKNH